MKRLTLISCLLLIGAAVYAKAPGWAGKPWSQATDDDGRKVIVFTAVSPPCLNRDMALRMAETDRTAALVRAIDQITADEVKAVLKKKKDPALVSELQKITRSMDMPSMMTTEQYMDAFTGKGGKTRYRCYLQLTIGAEEFVRARNSVWESGSDSVKASVRPRVEEMIRKISEKSLVKQ